MLIFYRHNFFCYLGNNIEDLLPQKSSVPSSFTYDILTIYY